MLDKQKRIIRMHACTHFRNLKLYFHTAYLAEFNKIVLYIYKIDTIYIKDWFQYRYDISCRKYICYNTHACTLLQSHS